MFNIKEFNKNNLIILLLVTAISLFIISGCAQRGKAEPTQGDAAEKDISVYTIADPIGDWGFPSPYSHYQRGPGYIRMSFIFDTLVWKDNKGLVYALAETWSYEKEDNAYIFDLNKKATWHDGTKFTARDVAFTIKYMKEHAYAWVDLTKIDKVEILEEYKVKMYLSETYAPFLNNIAATLPILPEHIWNKVENPVEFIGQKAVIGTGPYKLSDYNKEQGTYLYEANNEYYMGKPKFQKIRFVKLSNEMAFTALDRGEVNLCPLPPEIQGEMSQQGVHIIKGNHDWALKLIYNHTKEPFSNRKLRQAIAYAIDRNEMVKITKRGYALAGSDGLISPDSEWFNENIAVYEYAPEKAHDILLSLGYEELKLELLVKPDYEREGQFIKQQLEDIGIKVNLVSMEDKTIDARIKEWKFDLAISGHGGLGSDPEILNKVILGNGFNSVRYYQNKELVNLLKNQITVMEQGDRKIMISKIQELYAKELPSLTIYYPDWYWGHDGRIELFNTDKGIGYGIPLPFNKISFIK